MRILLIDVDSTIPNLALMKISAYEKSRGNQVGFNIDNPDKVYCSIIFDWNSHKADGLKFLYPHAEIDIGGSGYDLSKKLPPEIDSIEPDYSLYPGCDYDLGFTTRGCIRSCYFCIVPKKEGAFRINQHPRLFHNPNHKKVMLLDNNILSDKDWFMVVTEWILHLKLKVDFNQGLDIRLMDYEIAGRLKELKPIDYWRFAFDSLQYTNAVKRGIDILKDVGVNVRARSIWYVYLHDDSQFDDALKRCLILRDLGVLPYPMFNRHAKRTPRMTALKRWCRPWIFFTTTWEEYNPHQSLLSVQKITLQKGSEKMGDTITQNMGNIGGGFLYD